MRARNRAFTLIELLVVIAIIAILAAILFPVFTQAKESAKQAQCVMQMRQIGIALQMYSDENDTFWAPIANGTDAGANFAPQNVWVGYDNKNAGNNGGWYGDIQKPAKNPVRPGMIDPYLKSQDVKKCPKKPAQAQLVMAYNYWFGENRSSYWARNPGARGNEYGPGAKSCHNERGFVVCQSVNDSEIQEPSYTATVWEHGSGLPGCEILQEYDWFDSAPPSQHDHFHLLHRDGAVIVWADTHVRRMDFKMLRRPMFSVRKDIYP